MTVVAILVWLVILVGTAYLLKTLIFTKNPGTGKGCCAVCEGSDGGEEGAKAAEFSSDVISKKRAPVSDGRKKKSPATEEKKPEGEEAEE